MTEQTQWQMADDAASVYETDFVPALFAPWAAMIVGRATLRPGQAVLDVACGTGIGARTAVEHVGTPGAVTGLDLTPGMLAVAAELAPDIRWVEGSADALPFDDDSFDAAISLFGLMFVPDKAGALREMMRVLKPGAAMSVAVWHDHEHCAGYGAVVDLLRRVAGDTPADWMCTPFSMGDVGELEILCADAGLDGASIDTLQGCANFPSLQRWIHTQLRGTPIAPLVDDGQYEAFQAAAAEEFTHYLTPAGTVEFPMEAHVITARKA